MSRVSSIRTVNFFGHKEVDLSLPSNGVVLVTGANGCLQGNTLIYDPVEGDTTTVVERWCKGLPFHVWALSPHGVVVTAAMPPEKFPEAQMMTLVCEGGIEVTATPQHRFWDGRGWVSLSSVYERVQEGGLSLLVSSSDSDLSTHARDGFRWMETLQGSLGDCLRGPRFDDAPPPSDQDNALGFVPSQAYVPERNRCDLHTDGLVSLEEYSRFCLQCDHHARNRCAAMEPHEFECGHRLIELLGQLDYHSSRVLCQSLPETCLFRKALLLSSCVQGSTIQGSDAHGEPSQPPSGNNRYVYKHTGYYPWMQEVKVVSVEPLECAYYYDFHIPVFGNYWAQGLWHHNSGKSTLIEALSVALWGKTLRGTTWKVDRGKQSHVSVTLDQGPTKAHYSRERTDRGIRVTMEAPEGSAITGTSKKLQKKINAEVGPFGAWRRSFVYSSQDVAAFSSATDAERKRLLEAILETSIFDRALKRCREDVVGARYTKQTLEIKHSHADQHRASEQGAIERLSDIGPAPEEVSSGAVSAALAKQKEDSGALNAARMQLQSLKDELARTERAIINIRRKRDEVKTRDFCPACEQIIGEPQRQKLATLLNLKIDTHRSRRETLISEIKPIAQAIGALRCNADVSYSAVSSISAKHQEYMSWLSAKTSREAIVARAQRAVHDLECSLLDLEDAIDEARCDLSELECVEEVLGVRGFRTVVLSDALATVEHLANVWLERLFPGVELGIRSQEDADGSSLDGRIVLEITGVGHKDGYDGCSGGERRRIDVALLLALAQFRLGSGGEGCPSVLFLDEIFDSLDKEGSLRVGDVLDDISSDRCVVLISHSDRIVQDISPVMHVVFRDGLIQECRSS